MYGSLLPALTMVTHDSAQLLGNRRPDKAEDDE